jgi:hypothetical protein
MSSDAMSDMTFMTGASEQMSEDEFGDLGEMDMPLIVKSGSVSEKPVTEAINCCCL